jgi:hypothetical protein
MREDWSHWFIEMKRHANKSLSYLEAAQCLGPVATPVALCNAEIALLEAIHAGREALASVRAKQKAPGSF